MLRNPNHARPAPVEPPYDTETADALSALGPPIALFRLLARRPERARAVHGGGSYYLSRRCALTLRHRELVIDRVSALCGAEYEWRIHVDAFAAKAGLSDAQVRSLTAGDPSDACWTDPADAALLRAVDALHTRHDLTDDEWAGLVAATGEEGAIDAILICGWYHAIAFLARAARLPLEA
ncbi:carboxymuconolactone decarboxylase family protein [Dactylosporangium darangshiense]|uniref:Carboxymuconolactone decarboxylase family protein n=1 Tax=Dactylosporangium darangshiense TaxID=579108 RepID=A0ABP8DID9_9ACTN